MRMPAGRVVDGHVKLEIMAIDAQFRQFVGGDQQMQRWLFIAQVVADQLGKKIIAVAPQCQLQGALQVTLVVQFRHTQATQPAQ
ncbi:hypothetical protein D3C72_2021940 [compost metagenome]